MAHFTQSSVIYEIGGFKYMWTNQIKICQHLYFQKNCSMENGTHKGYEVKISWNWHYYLDRKMLRTCQEFMQANKTI